MRLFLLFRLLHEAGYGAALDARRGVLRRRAMGAHALLLQPVRGSSKYANRLRFAIARLASIQIDPSPALTVYLLSYNLVLYAQCVDQRCCIPSLSSYTQAQA